MSASQITAGIVRYGPAAFFTIVALFYTARILWLRARLGHSPVSYGAPGSLSHRIYATFRLFRVLIWLAAVARAVWPPFDRFLVPVIPLATPGVMVVGNLLMVAGFSCIVLLNFGMGRDWRSGLHGPADDTPLRTSGAHRWCRHPMFALIMVGQLGLFLAIPSLFTLLCLAIGTCTVACAAALEEIELERRHGERWRAYAAATPRWPWSRLLTLPARFHRAS